MVRRTGSRPALDAMEGGHMTTDLALDEPADAADAADAADEMLSGTHRLAHNQLRLLTARQGPLQAAAAALAT